MVFLLFNLFLIAEVSLVRSNLEQVNTCFDSSAPINIDKTFICFNEIAPCTLDISSGTKVNAVDSEFGPSVTVKTVQSDQFEYKNTIFSGQVVEGYPATKEQTKTPKSEQVSYSDRTLNSIDLEVLPGKIAKFKQSSICVGPKSGDCRIHLSENAGIEIEDTQMGRRLEITSEDCISHFKAKRATILGPIIKKKNVTQTKVTDPKSKNTALVQALHKKPFYAKAVDRGILIEIPDKVFNFDQSSLTNFGERQIEILRKSLSKIKSRALSVEGHTDKQNPEKFNLILSQARADAIAERLNNPRIVKVKGFGSKKPRYRSRSALSQDLNNRVEIIVENFNIVADLNEDSPD